MTFEDWNNSHPEGLFRFGDQGILNYLVHSYNQKGDRKVVVSDLQYHVEHHGQKEIDDDTASAGWFFPRQIKRPRVCHFCGKKPFLSDPRAYSRAFTIARLEHHRLKSGETGAWLSVFQEETRVLAKKLRRRIFSA
jgi:hypothetical protein